MTVEEDLLEEARRVAYWTGCPLSHLVADSLRMSLEIYLDEAAQLVDPVTGEVVLKRSGEGYPQRGELKQGRPAGR